jgi:hypothetical protein
MVGSLGGGIGETIVAVPRSLQRTITTVLRGSDILQVDTGGNFEWYSSVGPVVQLGSWASSALAWGGYSTLYDEFLPLEFRLRVAPLPATTVSNQYFLAYDADGGAPASPTLANISAYGTAKMLDIKGAQELAYKVVLPTKDLWYNVGTPSAWGAQMVLSPLVGNFIASPYAAVYYEIVVRFRGVR